jgi:hypothetical protein
LRKRNPKYKVRAWYYAPVIDNSGATSKTYEENPTMFYCAYVSTNRAGFELLTNSMVEGNDKVIETDELIEFNDQGKICFDYINPSIERADKIQRDGIQTLYGDKAMAQSNRFKSNRFIKKRIKVG